MASLQPQKTAGPTKSEREATLYLAEKRTLFVGTLALWGLYWDEPGGADELRTKFSFPLDGDHDLIA
jgi:hypothetical protein